jgi:NitT/TauT family transport system substrate-binding protein
MRLFLSIMVAAAILMPLTTSAADIAPLPVTIRVGSSFNDSNAEAYYAVANGFFKQAGVNVEMMSFTNGAAAAAAVASGSLDIAVQPPMQIAQALISGLPFVVIAAGAINSASAPAAWVCVNTSSTIRIAKDLEGKTIAINALKSSSENLLDAWLAKNGVDLTKIHFLELPSAQMAPALERGTVDAVELFEPAFTVAKAKGDIRVLGIPTAAMAAPRDEFLQTTWYTTKQFATQNKEAVRRFASAIYMAARWANTHPHDSGAILAELSKLDPRTVATMTRTRYAESLQPRDLLPELDNGFKFGLLSRALAPSELLNTSM